MATDTKALGQLISKWLKVKEQATLLAIEESALRDAVFKMGFPAIYEDADAKGTFNELLPKGYKLKVELSQNVKVDNAVLQAQWKHLIDVKKMPMDTIIRYSPELSMTAYNTLSAEQKVLLKDILTFKRGKPAITLVEPKPAKEK